MKYVKSRRSYGFLITKELIFGFQKTKELIFGFQILDLKDHLTASLKLYRAKMALSITKSESESPDNPSNYRGISISSCLGKLFTSVINNRITEFVYTNHLIKFNQIGFRKGYRTADHVFVMKTLIDNYLNKGKKLYLCFVDFAKAYDSVWRKGLFYKLIGYGFSVKILKLLKSMYSNITTGVRLSNGITDLFQSKIGVRQGCNLSPMLFNLFINDIVASVGNGQNTLYLPGKLNNISINCLLYADDLVFISESANGLQRCLNDLNSFCDKWHMKINLTKTKCMIITRNGHGEKLNFKFNGEGVTQTNSYCYLGTMISSCGSFSLAMRTQYKKGIKAMFALLSSINRTKNASPKLLLNLFDKMVVPIILYNSEIWGAYLFRNKQMLCENNDFLFDLKNILEDLHIKFMKVVLGVNSKTCNLAVRSELGRLPLHIKIFSSVLKYWARLDELSDNPIMMNALESNMELFASKKFSWISPVNKLLDVLDLLDYWRDRNNITSKTSFALIVKKKLNEAFSQTWENQMSTSNNMNSKLDFYKKIKRKFTLKQYLLGIKNGDIRRSVTRFRISAHKFPVEIERYVKVPRELRTCTICYEGIGNEFHYFSECSHVLIELSRMKFLDKIKSTNENILKLDPQSLTIYAAMMNDQNILDITARFIHEVMILYEMVAVKYV